MAKRRFIPADKPKSWVLFLIAVLAALLVFAPLTVIGIVTDIGFIRVIGKFGFVFSALIGFASCSVFSVGLMAGKYKHIKSLPWKERLW